ncbi:MAG: hypothetical protein Q4C65_08365 [Eubacteriales bacterium]|nr:hypothetical protein [Eubacteriales bacterium]
MWKKGARGLLFACAAAFLIAGLNRILCVKSPHGVDQARYLYVQPKNTVDVLFLGSSHVHCNVSPQILWEEHGMASYLLTGAEQPIWNSYYYLVEALKTQKPRLVVLDMFCPARFYEDYQYKWLDQNLDGMAPSLNKWRAVKASTEIERADYLLGFPKYHSRYGELTKADFQNFVWNREQQARWKGYTPLVTHAGLTEPDVSHVTGVREMSDKSREYFDKIVALTRREGIALALISGPYLLEDSDQEVYNSIGRIAQEEGLLFFNTNTRQHYRAMGLDFGTDFADHAHLNEAGSAKYTEYLGEWLDSHYELPDRRGQERYASWEEQVFYEEESAP